MLRFLKIWIVTVLAANGALSFIRDLEDNVQSGALGTHLTFVSGRIGIYTLFAIAFWSVGARQRFHAAHFDKSDTAT